MKCEMSNCENEAQEDCAYCLRCEKLLDEALHN